MRWPNKFYPKYLGLNALLSRSSTGTAFYFTYSYMANMYKYRAVYQDLALGIKNRSL